jgi:RNA recognition motif-containing protein
MDFDHINQNNDINVPWQRASKDPKLVVRGTELFIGNLSLDIIDQDLYDEFKEFGEIIDVSII